MRESISNWSTCERIAPKIEYWISGRQIESNDLARQKKKTSNLKQQLRLYSVQNFPFTSQKPKEKGRRQKMRSQNNAQYRWSICFRSFEHRINFEVGIERIRCLTVVAGFYLLLVHFFFSSWVSHLISKRMIAFIIKLLLAFASLQPPYIL